MIQRLHHKNGVVIVLGAFLFIAALNGYTQTVNVPYNFPVKPGTPEWAKFQTHADMLAACQIPEDVLKNISTKALVTTCLNYPLYADLNAYDALQDGMNTMIARFNGLQELLKRKDSSSWLLDSYEAQNPETDIKISKWRYIEALVAQDSILIKLSPDQRLKALQLTVNKYDRKKKLPELYGAPFLTPNCVIAAKVMKLEGISLPGQLLKDLEKGYILNLEALDSVRSLVKNQFGF